MKILGVKDNACLWVPEHVNYFMAIGLAQLLNRSRLYMVHTKYITLIRYDAVSRRLPMLKGFSGLLNGLVTYGQLPINKLFNALRMEIYLNVYARKRKY